MSNLIKTYSILNDIITQTVDIVKLCNQISESGFVEDYASLSKEGDFLKVWGDSMGNESGLDDLVRDHNPFDLDEYKQYKNDNQIDKRTEELILSGYDYGGTLMSSSLNSQANLMAVHKDRNEAWLSYPITFSSKDNLSSISIANATELNNLYLAFLSHKKGHMDSGNVLKDQVRAATTKGAVDAIIDSR